MTRIVGLTNCTNACDSSKSNEYEISRVTRVDIWLKIIKELSLINLDLNLTISRIKDEVD